MSKPKKPKQPQSINDLKPAPYNNRVRQISQAALKGLQHSLERHGDISGITYNLETGNLVSGHQRIEALKAKYGADNLRLEPAPIDGQGVIYAPDGNTYSVRYVRLSPAEEKAANLAANSTDIAGEFLWEGVEEMLLEIQGAGMDMLDTGFMEETIKYLFGMEGRQKESTTREVNFNAVQTKHKCPKCGFEYDK